MSVTAMPNGNEKTYIWAAQDHSDDDREGTMEKFAARFKNKEIADKFRDTFNAMRALKPVED